MLCGNSQTLWALILNHDNGGGGAHNCAADTSTRVPGGSFSLGTPTRFSKSLFKGLANILGQKNFHIHSLAFVLADTV